MTTTLNKYLSIIKTGLIEERQLIDLRSFMNRNKEAANAIFEAWDGHTMALTHEHAQKGYEFLLTQWKTPRGVERKNNPFGYREQAILENYSHIELKSLYNAGRSDSYNYLPLYEVVSKDGSTFEYYYDGKINITG